MRTKTQKGYYGMVYVTIVGIPVKKTKFGDAIDIDSPLLETLVAKALIERRVPLRGIEVKFLRKALGLSLEKFGGLLQISAVAVHKWERKEKDRLDPINEVAVRSLLAEKLKLNMRASFSGLLGDEEAPELRVKAG